MNSNDSTLTYDKLLETMREFSNVPEAEQLLMNKHTFAWLQNQIPLLDNDQQFEQLGPPQYVIRESVPDRVMIRWGVRSQAILGFIRINGNDIEEVSFPPRKNTEFLTTQYF